MPNIMELNTSIYHSLINLLMLDTAACLTYGSVELVGFLKRATIAGRRVRSLLDENLLLQWTPHMKVTRTDCRHNLEQLQDTLYIHLLSYTLCYLRSCFPGHN